MFITLEDFSHVCSQEQKTCFLDLTDCGICGRIYASDLCFSPLYRVPESVYPSLSNMPCKKIESAKPICKIAYIYELCLVFPVEVWVGSSLLQGQGLCVWVWHKSSWRK